MIPGYRNPMMQDNKRRRLTRLYDDDAQECTLGVCDISEHTNEAPVIPLTHSAENHSSSKTSPIVHRKMAVVYNIQSPLSFLLSQEMPTSSSG